MKNLALKMSSVSLVMSLVLLFGLNSFNAQAETWDVDQDELERMVRMKSDNLRMYFSEVSLSQIKKADGGTAIKSGFEDTKTQVSTLQQIFNGLSGNDDAKVREYVYNQLLSVDSYQKASGFLGKAALKTAFNNYTEPEGSLKSKVKELRGKFE